jgi:RNA polymerase sigma factor FliA
VSAKAKTIQREYREISQLGQEERDRMLTETLPQVHYIARRIHDRLPPHVPLEDLVSAGIVGLLEAIHNFDPARSENIKGYAKHRIQGAILDSLRDLDWSPRDLRKKGRQIEEALHKLRTSLGRAPSETELAESQGMSLKELQSLLADLRGLHLGSLQALAPEPGREDEIDKYLPYAPEEDQLYLCQRSELRECLAHAVKELPDRERQMLALYYVEELTMKEVGAVLGVGEGRISQLHSAALLRLRARIQELLSLRRCERAVDKPCEGTRTWVGT